MRFWQDPWVDDVGPLSDQAIVVPEEAWNFFVSAYADDNGWRWDLLQQLFLVHICKKIASIKPPRAGSDDFPLWEHSSDGYFSIKSAYNFFFKDLNEEPPSFPFDVVWKWLGPPRIQALLWKVAHGRLLTNDERCRRGMTDSDICPRCNNQPETILHATRDCEVISSIWSKII